jgi:uncharacterized iron-regulated membrane protein
MDSLHTNTSSVSVQRPLHRLFWRLHFWAGLIVSPVVLLAAVTGLLYVFTPQIEAWRHGHLDQVPLGTQRMSLDAQVAAAQVALPGQTLRYVVPAYAPGDTTQVFFNPRPLPQGEHTGAAGLHDHGLPMGTIAYVNPATAQVVGHLQEMERFKTWAKKLHSSALQGERWRWPLELAASWMLVLFGTGLYLWWPRSVGTGGRGLKFWLPRAGQGRLSWRYWHGLLAVLMGLVLCTLTVTGLTWSEFAGARFKAMQQALAQSSPRIPAALQSTDNGSPPWGWDEVWMQAKSSAPDISLMITPPTTAQAIWRIENFDRSQATKRFVLALDAYGGKTLFFAGWQDMPTLARATALGIPFHRGELGVWNQVLLVLAALTAMFSVVSGFAMWWLRRPPGRVAAPSVGHRELRTALQGTQGWALGVLALLLAYALPVFGVSLLLFLLLEVFRLYWLSQPHNLSAMSR